MKYNSKNLIFTLFLFSLFVILTTSVSAFTTLIRSDVTGHGISLVDTSHIYIQCLGHECDSIGLGVNVSIIKLNALTDTVSRSDYLGNINTYLPIIPAYDNYQDGIDTNVARNTQMFGSTGYYVYSFSDGYDAGQSHYNTYASIYTYNYGTGFFYNTTTSPYNFITYAYTNCYPRGVNKFNPVMTFNALSSTPYPNNTLIDWRTITYSDPANCFSTLGLDQYMWKDSNNQLHSISITGDVLRNINPTTSSSSTYTYTTSIYYDQGFNQLGTFNTTLSGISDGLIDEPNNYYYISTGSNIYKGTVTGTKNSNTPAISIKTNSTTCTNIIDGSTTLYSIACQNRTMCVFVGKHGSDSYLVSYNGQDCYDATSELQEWYNVTDRPLYDVAFDSGNKRFFVVGKNVTLKYFSDAIYNQTTINGTTLYSHPLCVPNSNTATFTYCSQDSNGTINCYNNQTRAYGVCNAPFYSNPTNVLINNSLFATNGMAVSWFCNVDDVQSCTLGCADFPIGGGYYSAQCVNTPTEICSNDVGCNLDGLLDCQDSTTVRRCVYSNPNTGGDGCLHWNYDSTCIYGEICSAGTCGTEPTTTNSITYPTFTVSPYTPNSAFSVNFNTRSVSQTSTNLASTFQFMISTSQSNTYTGLSCNYQETPVLSVGTPQVSNMTNNVTFISPPIYNSDSKIFLNLKIIPNSTVGGVRVYVTDSSDNIISKIYVERDVSSNSVCTYFTNGTNDKSSLIYCITDVVNVYNGDLFTYTLLWNAKRYTTTMSAFNINRYSGVFTWDYLSAINIGKIIIESTNNSVGLVYSINISTVSGLPSYSPTIVQTTTDYYCTYTSNGCKTSRFYMSPENTYLYDNYQQWTLCVNTPTGTGSVGGNGTIGQPVNNVQPNSGTQSFIDSWFGTNLSGGEKLMYALLYIFVGSLLLLIIGFASGLDAIAVGALTIAIDVIMLVFFAYIGFIPVWLVIMVAIITAGVLAMYFKKMVGQ